MKKRENIKGDIEEDLEVKKGQYALEFFTTHAWAIFIILLAIGVFSFIFMSNIRASESIFKSIGLSSDSISGKAIFSSEILEIPKQVSQNSNLQITINPTNRGVYKFGYIYDSKDNLKQIFSFDCEDICYEKKTSLVFINESYLGDYYVYVFDYKEDDYIKKFIVVDEETEIGEVCTLERAYWDKKSTTGGQPVSLIAETKGCDGKKAEFTIYETDGIFGKQEIKKLQGIIQNNRVEVKWNAEYEQETFLFLYFIKTDPEYYFHVEILVHVEQ